MYYRWAGRGELAPCRFGTDSTAMARSPELARLFQLPDLPAQRHYEICRAYFHDETPAAEIAQRLHLHVGSVRAIVRDFARDPDVNAFFATARPGRKTSPKRDAIHQRACELRRQGATLADIRAALQREGFDVSESYLFRILRRAGLATTRQGRPVRQPGDYANDGSLVPDIADARALVLEDGRQFPTKVAGLFLFLPLLLLSVAKRRKVFNWQSGTLEERPDQTRPLSQAADGKMEFQLKFFQVQEHHIAQLDMLQVLPDALDRVEVGGVRRQSLDVHTPALGTRQEILDLGTAVDGRPIPDHQKAAPDVVDQAATIRCRGQFGGQFGVGSSLLLPLHQVGKLDSWEDFQDRQAMTLFTTRSTAGTTEPMSSAPTANGICSLAISPAPRHGTLSRSSATA